MFVNLRASGRRLLVHSGGWLVIALAVAAVAAPAASADRAYASAGPGALRDLFVLRMSDDGSALRFASIHMEVICRGQVEHEFGRTLKISRRTPTARQLDDNDYLKAGKRRSGRLLARLYYSDYPDDGEHLLRGTLRLQQISETSLRASWTIRSTWNPDVGPSRSCLFRRTFEMRRSPGEIFVGASSHSEPVALVRDPGGGAVGVSIGYYADCLPVDEPWGLYVSALALAPDGSFAVDGPDAALAAPGWLATYRLHGRFVSSRRATGRFALTATTRPRPRTCSSDRTWSATSG